MMSFPQSMKRFRLLLLAVAAAVGLCAIALGVLFNSTFQTWAARRAIAAQPGVQASLGELSAGMKRVTLKDLRYEHAGAVITLPHVEMDVPVAAAAMNKQVDVTRRVAKGWTIDLSKTGAAVAPASSANQTTGAATALPQAVAAAFSGVFAQLQLPIDLALDGVQLEGEVVLPEKRGRVNVTLKGGGFGGGKEGKLDIVAQAALTDPNVSSLEVRGALTGTMDTPRTFTRVATRLDAAASGKEFPQGVKLAAELSAARGATGETYRLAVVAAGQEIVNVTADLPRGAPMIAGAWKLDVRDAEVAPFAFGKPLPAFTVVGAGAFDTDVRLSAVHVSGRLNATVDRLQIFMPEMSVLGELMIGTEFDLAQTTGGIAVRKLEATVAAAAPIASVRALQAFEFNWQTREVRASDLAGELFGLELHGAPVAWAQPFLKAIAVTGGPIRGQLVANARGGGVTLRSTAPLRIEGVRVVRAGATLVERVDVALNASADYTPHGWQAEIAALEVKSGAAKILTLAAKAGQLAGQDQAVKATGKLTLDLPALLAQPVAAGALTLSGGEAVVEFVGSLHTTSEIHAKVSLAQLATSVDSKPLLLPVVAFDVRADVGSDGKIAFNAPITFERGGRKSDLTVIGSVGPEKDKVRVIDAQLTSGQFIVDDAQILGVVVPEKVPKKPGADQPEREATPPWAGLQGAVSLALKRVIYSDAFEVTNLSGRLQIDAGMVKLEGLQAGLGEGGRINLNGAVTFTTEGPQHYALVADVAVKEFDVAPLFRAIDHSRPATVEGRFDMASKVAAQAAKLADLAPGLQGDFHLTSRGGIFRGLPVNVSRLADNTSKISGWIASAGTAISSMAGKKEYADIGNKVQAVAEFAKGLNPIPYDQLSVVMSRDAAFNTTLKDFTLISPELRLTGGGTALHRPGSSLLEDALAMEFKLRARGRPGDLLKYLGVLETQPDDFGYATCTLPLKINGTLAKVETNELNARLAAIALEKSGVTDKAADLVNKIFGGGK